MIVQLPFPATLDDLMKVDGKAELVAGRIVSDMATGFLPGLVAKRILRRIDDYIDITNVGVGIPDNVGYALPVPLLNGRQSFSPDASFYSGPLPANRMKFVSGPPTFAVEVRSENDYGRTAERGMADKRDDYFEAGTLVVWDVDPDQGVVTKYTATAAPVVFRDGEVADAEPALPGWRLAVADVFHV